MICPVYAEKLIEILGESGHKAYFVGGCVRDMIMGRTPNDYDITTSAMPQETLALFESLGYKVFCTGMKHGTVSVLSEGHCIEITTYRIDGDYKDSRHPTSVVFTDRLQDDLKRRDFTVNAMAYNEKSGIVDIFGGKNDISEKRIRCVGNPLLRFDEDALRIMRAARFASTLGFGIEEKTFSAMRKKADRLVYVSAERIKIEFEKAITGDFAADGLDIMQKSGIIGVIMPELEPFLTESKIYGIEKIKKDFCVRMAFLLSNLESKSAFEILNFLKLSAAEKTRIKTLLSSLSEDFPSADDRYGIRLLIRRYGDDIFDAAELCAKIRNEDFALLVSAIETEKSKNPCVDISGLAVSGNDLIALGICEGREIGEILKKLLEEVLFDESLNEKEILKEKASAWHEKRRENRPKNSAD